MTRSAAPTLLLHTPYLAAANNGNWRTAARWKRLLSSYRVIVQSEDASSGGADRSGGHDAAIAMIALHARRSRAVIRAWHARYPQRALIVALTGTDLYKDLPAGDLDARSSIEEAHRLIVLQGDAVNFLPPEHRHKADVVFQSSLALAPIASKGTDRLRCVLVAHLRPEKDPATVFAAWRALPVDLPILLTVVGYAIDSTLGDAARRLADDDARVRWVGPKSHAWTRQAIRRAHLLLCPSRMEGGANVIVEAVTAGTPVVASRVSGNVGMLGDDYPGYFAAGDSAALSRLLLRCLREREFVTALSGCCAQRAALFEPVAESASLEAAVGHALASASGLQRGGPERIADRVEDPVAGPVAHPQPDHL